MTRQNGPTPRHRRALGGIAILLAAAMTTATTTARAQGLDPGLDVAAVGVIGDGRVLVRNGGNLLDCALTARAEAVELTDCRFQGTTEALALLQALTDEDWQGLVRDTLQDAQCRLSAFTAMSEVVLAAAEARGATPAMIDSARAELSARAETAVSQMLRDGKLSFREGELALDACP